MNNLVKRIAMSLSLALIAASLAALSTDQAQAKVKKQAGNSAKANRAKVAVAEAFSIDIGTSENLTEKRRLKTANRKRR